MLIYFAWEKNKGVFMKWILLMTTLLIVGCSTMKIVKQCQPVEGGDDTFVCKTLKFWE
jgi:hypothetical protein